MVKVKEDLTGRIFGRLTVIKQAEDYVPPNGRPRSQWLCQCSCGNKPKVIRGCDLKNNRVVSCGCYLSEKLKEPREKIGNEYDLSGGYGVGWTNNTNEEFYFDLEDYLKIKDYTWYVDFGGSTKQLKANINGKSVLMHTLLGFKNYDHEDRNELNNKKSNFRICTKQENCRNRSIQSNNTSGFIGVSYHKKDKKWIARINDNNKNRITVYHGESKYDAIVARLKAEKNIMVALLHKDIYLKNTV